MAETFDRLIETLDRALFRQVPTQSKQADQWAWLAVQRHVRRRFDPYAYLEIGSYLGGSLQPHLRDPRCERVFSIDARPLSQPDARLASGCQYPYPGNSREMMMAGLRARLPRHLHKLVCYDCDAAQVPRDAIQPAPHMILIDGEHTDRAVLSDFEFCAAVAHPDAVIMLHDYPLVTRAMKTIARCGPWRGRAYTHLVYAWSRNPESLPEFTVPTSQEGRRQ